MNIDEIEAHNVSSLAKRLLTSRATAGRLLCFGRLKPVRETHSGAFYAKADLDKIRAEEVTTLREKCSKLTGTERENLAAFFSECSALENGRRFPDEADRKAGQMKAAAGPIRGTTTRSTKRERMRLSSGGIFS